MNKRPPIMLLQDEAQMLHELAERLGLTPGEVLRALIMSEAYRQRLVQPARAGKRREELTAQIEKGENHV